MDFGQALVALKADKRVARPSWNGKDMFVVLMPELRLPPHNTQDINSKVSDRTAKWIGEDKPLNCRPYFAICNTRTGEWQPGWVPSIGDCMAEDWEIL